MGSMFEVTTEEKAKMLLDAPLVELSELQHGFYNETRQEVVEYLDALIEKAARVRAYLDVQSEFHGTTGSKHNKAVAKGNKLVATIRKMTGYSYPTRDIQF